MTEEDGVERALQHHRVVDGLAAGEGPEPHRPVLALGHDGLTVRQQRPGITLAPWSQRRADGCRVGDLPDLGGPVLAHDEYELLVAVRDDLPSARAER